MLFGLYNLVVLPSVGGHLGIFFHLCKCCSFAIRIHVWSFYAAYAKEIEDLLQKVRVVPISHIRAYPIAS